MKLVIRLIAGAKRNLIIKEKDGLLKVYVRAPAIEGKANRALVRELAGYFGLSKSRVKIIKGLKSRHKIVEVYDK